MPPLKKIKTAAEKGPTVQKAKCPECRRMVVFEPSRREGFVRCPNCASTMGCQRPDELAAAKDKPKDKPKTSNGTKPKTLSDAVDDAIDKFAREQQRLDREDQERADAAKFARDNALKEREAPKPKAPTKERSATRLYVHPSNAYLIVRITDGKDTDDYFVSHVAGLNYVVTKMVPHAAVAYAVNCSADRPRCGCDGFKFNQSCRHVRCLQALIGDAVAARSR